MARSAGLTNYLYVAEIDLEQRRLLHKASLQIGSSPFSQLIHDIRRSTDRRSMLFCMNVRGSDTTSFGIISLEDFTLKSSTIFIPFEFYYDFIERAGSKGYYLLGRLVASQVVSGTRLEFVTNHIPSGNYYLHWKQKHGHVSSSPVMVAYLTDGA